MRKLGKVTINDIKKLISQSHDVIQIKARPNKTVYSNASNSSLKD